MWLFKAALAAVDWQQFYENLQITLINVQIMRVEINFLCISMNEQSFISRVYHVTSRHCSHCMMRTGDALCPIVSGDTYPGDIWYCWYYSLCVYIVTYSVTDMKDHTPDFWLWLRLWLIRVHCIVARVIFCHTNGRSHTWLLRRDTCRAWIWLWLTHVHSDKCHIK